MEESETLCSMASREAMVSPSELWEYGPATAILRLASPSTICCCARRRLLLVASSPPLPSSMSSHGSKPLCCWICRCCCCTVCCCFFGSFSFEMMAEATAGCRSSKSRTCRVGPWMDDGAARSSTHTLLRRRKEQSFLPEESTMATPWSSGTRARSLRPSFVALPSEPSHGSSTLPNKSLSHAEVFVWYASTKSRSWSPSARMPYTRARWTSGLYASRSSR
mmetsp:Transcript_38364/g.108437  ORF Transcript_38364/g.108437 Transcript_38364/m.108437 type:complete len:221 (+) Transcript_38364:434-1096(+)